MSLACWLRASPAPARHKFTGPAPRVQRRGPRATAEAHTAEEHDSERRTPTLLDFGSTQITRRSEMTRPVINPGVVDWSGENPGMYLREAADGPFVTLISYFRVVLSPKGRGHAAFILQDPHGDGRNAAKPNLC